MSLLGGGSFRQGVWWVSSKSDPRWDGQGEGIVGGLIIPDGATEHIKEMEEKLGEPPEDLEYGYMKE